jgi:hypothetical protein
MADQVLSMMYLGSMNEVSSEAWAMSANMVALVGGLGQYFSNVQMA